MAVLLLFLSFITNSTPPKTRLYLPFLLRQPEINRTQTACTYPTLSFSGYLSEVVAKI
ncbi:hypothetical protein BACSTE_00372 [Bacteroides stercoris ATCC 43183]|uniref:Uncharacterized protein n=1 Tax=Bacteroides stercoris ATCC 43183 TaxID=449673 RepID=B0NLQ3_BACSE|nr:hypothetical protein BACSTE_00372 [Bacteroides stercoris ATCC 43183]